MGSVQAARSLHQALLHNKMRSPQAFFDTTPSGRILNRFSKDVHVIDEVLGLTILTLLSAGCNTISTIVVIMASTPLFTVVILPLGVVYLFVQVNSTGWGRGFPGSEVLLGCRGVVLVGRGLSCMKFCWGVVLVGAQTSVDRKEESNSSKATVFCPVR